MKRNDLWAAAAVVLLGCGAAKEEPAPAPVAIPRGQACALDAMLIEAHDGPKVQLLRTDGSRAFFCDAKEVFAEWLDPVRGRRVAGVWFQTLDQGARQGGWAAPESLYFVAGSDQVSAMGPLLAPFAEAAGAAAFAAEHGGRIVRVGDIDASLLEALRHEGMTRLH